MRLWPDSCERVDCGVDFRLCVVVAWVAAGMVCH